MPIIFISRSSKRPIGVVTLISTFNYFRISLNFLDIILSWLSTFSSSFLDSIGLHKPTNSLSFSLDTFSNISINFSWLLGHKFFWVNRFLNLICLSEHSISLSKLRYSFKSNLSLRVFLMSYAVSCIIPGSWLLCSLPLLATAIFFNFYIILLSSSFSCSIRMRLCFSMSLTSLERQVLFDTTDLTKGSSGLRTSA